MKKDSEKSRYRIKLGELLLKYKVITEDQMQAALERQETIGGRLGQNLIRLNYLNEDVLLKFLSYQLSIDSLDLNKVAITAETQRLIPLETMEKFKVLPVKREQNSLALGMTNPTDLEAIRELEFSLGMNIVVLALAESQWDYAMSFFREHGWGKKTLTKKGQAPRLPEEEFDLRSLMQELVSQGGSDIHLSVGVQPTFRVTGQLTRLDSPPITREKMEALLGSVLTAEQKEYMSSHNEMDFALSFDGIGRFRFNIYRQRNNLAAALRYVAERVLSLKELGLPSWLPEYLDQKQGLVLIAGSSGHGTTTTLSCLIDIINSTRRANIITLEDPIEYLHRHKLGNINQRELGTDTGSFQDGIKYIFRQDPDVIGIGEMRDVESISMALTAAETGHLVLATLHTLNVFSTLSRIIDVFPSGQQNQVRHQLSEALVLVLSQRLVPRADKKGRILAYEKLSNSYRIQNAIRERRAHHFKSQVTAGQEDYLGKEDYLPIEQSLADLLRRKLITHEEAVKFAEDKKLLERFTKQ